MNYDIGIVLISLLSIVVLYILLYINLKSRQGIDKIFD